MPVTNAAQEYKYQQVFIPTKDEAEAKYILSRLPESVKKLFRLSAEYVGLISKEDEKIDQRELVQAQKGIEKMGIKTQIIG